MKKMTESEYRAGDQNGDGICLECGNTQGCVEPDAEDYICDSCGEARVYGLEQALLIGELEIVPDAEIGKVAGTFSFDTGIISWKQ